uniref:Uncharacterized protein n=1 Tax=Chromera velia CCMP2878 TaxID=1169474 RepID=A0A0G4HV46_9ALVE|eukprot:Cvel_1390.t1-p1 / transcript=Cvel_1390.t1 / gene=Cvel_1390 / organism=Chromera_velia_CCMP2878 / gene_product=hypothetical protein / transcript_product=hypothetical protein / location=Cvel_scaffold48:76088-82466(+) / protein_length=1702 / sequence_SO=supercontig / SO=protein_coding / is_pseudo=false
MSSAAPESAVFRASRPQFLSSEKLWPKEPTEGDEGMGIAETTSGDGVSSEPSTDGKSFGQSSFLNTNAANTTTNNSPITEDGSSSSQGASSVRLHQTFSVATPDDTRSGNLSPQTSDRQSSSTGPAVVDVMHPPSLPLTVPSQSASTTGVNKTPNPHSPVSEPHGGVTSVSTLPTSASNTTQTHSPVFCIASDAHRSRESSDTGDCMNQNSQRSPDATASRRSLTPGLDPSSSKGAHTQREKDSDNLFLPVDVQLQEEARIQEESSGPSLFLPLASAQVPTVLGDGANTTKIPLSLPVDLSRQSERERGGPTLPFSLPRRSLESAPLLSREISAVSDFTAEQQKAEGEAGGEEGPRMIRAISDFSAAAGPGSFLSIPGLRSRRDSDFRKMEPGANLPFFVVPSESGGGGRRKTLEDPPVACRKIRFRDETDDPSDPVSVSSSTGREREKPRSKSAVETRGGMSEEEAPESSSSSLSTVGGDSLVQPEGSSSCRSASMPLLIEVFEYEREPDWHWSDFLEEKDKRKNQKRFLIQERRASQGEGSLPGGVAAPTGSDGCFPEREGDWLRKRESARGGGDGAPRRRSCDGRTAFPGSPTTVVARMAAACSFAPSSSSAAASESADPFGLGGDSAPRSSASRTSPHSQQQSSFWSKEEEGDGVAEEGRHSAGTVSLFGMLVDTCSPSESESDEDSEAEKETEEYRQLRRNTHLNALPSGYLDHFHHGLPSLSSTGRQRSGSSQGQSDSAPRASASQTRDQLAPSLSLPLEGSPEAGGGGKLILPLFPASSPCVSVSERNKAREREVSGEEDGCCVTTEFEGPVLPLPPSLPIVSKTSALYGSGSASVPHTAFGMPGASSSDTDREAAPLPRSGDGGAGSVSVSLSVNRRVPSLNSPECLLPPGDSREHAQPHQGVRRAPSHPGSLASSVDTALRKDIGGTDPFSNSMDRQRGANCTASPEGGETEGRPRSSGGFPSFPRREERETDESPKGTVVSEASPLSDNTSPAPPSFFPFATSAGSDRERGVDRGARERERPENIPLDIPMRGADSGPPSLLLPPYSTPSLSPGMKSSAATVTRGEEGEASGGSSTGNSRGGAAGLGLGGLREGSETSTVVIRKPQKVAQPLLPSPAAAPPTANPPMASRAPHHSPSPNAAYRRLVTHGTSSSSLSAERQSSNERLLEVVGIGHLKLPSSASPFVRGGSADQVFGDEEGGGRAGGGAESPSILPSPVSPAGHWQGPLRPLRPSSGAGGGAGTRFSFEGSAAAVEGEAVSASSPLAVAGNRAVRSASPPLSLGRDVMRQYVEREQRGRARTSGGGLGAFPLSLRPLSASLSPTLLTGGSGGGRQACLLWRHRGAVGGDGHANVSAASPLATPASVDVTSRSLPQLPQLLDVFSLMPASASASGSAASSSSATATTHAGSGGGVQGPAGEGGFGTAYMNENVPSSSSSSASAGGGTTSASAGGVRGRPFTFSGSMKQRGVGGGPQGAPSSTGRAGLFRKEREGELRDPQGGGGIGGGESHGVVGGVGGDSSGGLFFGAREKRTLPSLPPSLPVSAVHHQNFENGGPSASSSVSSLAHRQADKEGVGVGGGPRLAGSPISFQGKSLVEGTAHHGGQRERSSGGHRDPQASSSSASSRASPSSGSLSAQPPHRLPPLSLLGVGVAGNTPATSSPVTRNAAAGGGGGAGGTSQISSPNVSLPLGGGQ